MNDWNIQRNLELKSNLQNLQTASSPEFSSIASPSFLIRGSQDKDELGIEEEAE